MKGWSHYKDFHDRAGKAIRHSLSAKGIKNKPIDIMLHKKIKNDFLSGVIERPPLYFKRERKNLPIWLLSKIPEDKKEELLQKYLSGVKSTVIAEEYGIDSPYKNVRHIRKSLKNTNRKEKLELIKDVYNILGHVPTTREFSVNAPISDSSIKKEFGTWNEALRLAGLPVQHEKRENPLYKKIKLFRTNEKGYGSTLRRIHHKEWKASKKGIEFYKQRLNKDKEYHKEYRLRPDVLKRRKEYVREYYKINRERIRAKYREKYAKHKGVTK